jgi:hypothetical protein
VAHKFQKPHFGYCLGSPPVIILEIVSQRKDTAPTQGPECTSHENTLTFAQQVIVLQAPQSCRFSSPVAIPLDHCRLWSVECRAWSVECACHDVWSVVCEV